MTTAISTDGVGRQSKCFWVKKFVDAAMGASPEGAAWNFYVCSLQCYVTSLIIAVTVCGLQSLLLYLVG